MGFSDGKVATWCVFPYIVMIRAPFRFQLRYELCVCPLQSTCLEGLQVFVWFKPHTHIFREVSGNSSEVQGINTPALPS